MEDLIRRQDAIDAVKEKMFWNMTGGFYGALKVLEDLPSAIAPQEQENDAIDAENDAIGRRAAIDAVIAEGRTVDSRYLESERIIHESDAVEALSMLPSADIPQGKWIETDRTYFGATVFKCSVCCDEIDEMPTVMGVPKYKYCPYCGIKMKGADDE